MYGSPSFHAGTYVTDGAATMGNEVIGWSSGEPASPYAVDSGVATNNV